MSDCLCHALAADVAALTALAFRAWHGSILSGVNIHTSRSSRSIFCSGGRLRVLEPSTAGLRFAERRFARPSTEPLAFMVVAGCAAVTHPDGLPMVVRLVPDGLAAVPGIGGSGSLVTPAPGTLRVDLLALAVDSAGDAEWFMVLGRPTVATTLAGVAGVEAPEIPAGFADALVPVARVTTRNGSRGVSACELVARRS